MNRDGVLEFFLIIALLGGVFLLAHRPAAMSSHASAPSQYHNQGNIKVIPVQEPRRYQNKEIRDTTLEYNTDGQMTKVKIEITRDYAIT